MNFSIGGAGNWGDSGPNNPGGHGNKGRKIYHRHTPYQITQLEAFFKECPHPDENQRRQLGRELGLDPKQIKFWFQNKRTQTKTQHERQDNAMLRAENERMQCENIAFREALKNLICPSCGGPPCGEQHLDRLHQENAQLKQEYERVSNILARCIGRPISELDSSADDPSSAGSPPSSSPGNSLNQGSTGSPISLDMDLGSAITVSDENMLPSLMGEVTDVEKDLMLVAANNAIDELLKLVRIEEPLWIKTEIGGGQFVLHRDSYEKLSPRANHFRSSSTRAEATKDSRMVWMNSMQLVDMFLDPVKWANLFPTIVRKAEILEVLDVGSSSANRSGALQLMYEEMHTLSPLVPPREFCFIRHCRQVDVGVWAIADVSFDSLRDNIPISRTWKFPSGCVIQEIPNGFSQVTWIEHVEVDDKTHTHRLYRELVSGNYLAYGAERWVVTLQRMCERLVFALDEYTPVEEAREVISSGDGRRSIMELANRMVRDFSEVLNMSGKEFPHLCEARNSGIRVSVRRNTEAGQPDGMVVTACTSLWLPVLHQTVFDFFTDARRRYQWDVLSNENPEHDEIARISNGTHPGNCIKIIREQPIIPDEKEMLILQETCTDALGSMLVYAPIDMPLINLCVRGTNTSLVPILPSGFMISGDATSSSSSSGGSLLTVAFQVLVCSNSAMRQLSVETVATINSLLSSTVEKIKDGLNCAGLD
ncbi:homeobox-leucine zipper protein ROC8-like [Prosopis cineraria]|uniref:homeobox-leucine zipper protein ROC8-like n=1 Tax=Prosopis cineraria TaxID=364024 RepID=UPI00240EB693|nr:homeobox-leucine zipper protein ROC8-like [Prosopis cineraria]